MVNTNPEMSEDQLETALAMTEKFTTPVMMMVMGFITYTVLSAVISLIASIFLKKEDTSLSPSI